MKKFFYIFILCILAVGIYYVVFHLYGKLSWGRVDTQSDLDIEVNNEEDVEKAEETVLYGQKFNYAVNYLKGFLGKNIELSDYVVVVDISEQTEYVFTKDGGFVDTNRISTGAFGSSQAMSESLWRVVSKVDSGLAPIYGPRLMLLDRYVGGSWINTTVALHGTEEPEKIGTPFGLGCFYHNNADIIALFDILSIGDYVVAID